MSSNAVTPSGFAKKTLAEIKAEYEQAFRLAFGEGIDLSASGPFGQLIGTLSKRDADMWDMAQAIYTSRDPGQATGVALDGICAETGVRRLDATPTVVNYCRLLGSAGTTIPRGAKIRRPGSTRTFSLAGAVYIGSDDLYTEGWLEVTSAQAGDNYDVGVNSNTYTYNWQSGDDAEAVIDALVALINAGEANVQAEKIAGPLLRLYLDGGVGFRFSAAGGIVAEGTYGAVGTFVCDEEGANEVPANTLTEVVTPVTNWRGVTNTIAGIIGREVETDAELRLRRLSGARTGKATEQAIVAALYQEVEDVISVTIASNRTNATDGEGRPPKSFETVVAGGLDTDVAQVIWEAMPAGIASYGNINADGSIDPDGDGTGIALVDSQGNPQTIHFSRPEPQYLWVRISRSLYYPEEAYPDDGDQQIKDRIVAWGLREYQLAVDVIYQRLAVPIYQVPGVKNIVIEVAVTDTPGGSPTYAEADIPIGARQIVQVDTVRITVQDL